MNNIIEVSRAKVVQSFLDLYDDPHYLEIGVWKGKTLFPARAAKKVGVDPTFAFDLEEARQKHTTTTFFNGTSDEYFATLDPGTKFDVIYVDGLHTVEQTLRDLINACFFIKEKGVIIVDDVRPTSFHSSLANIRHAQVVKAALGSTDKNWMGDVYKLVFFVQSFMQQYSYRTVSNNHGQLVIWHQRRASVTERSLEWVGRAPFESIFIEDASLNRTQLADIVREVARAYEIAQPHSVSIGDS